MNENLNSIVCPKCGAQNSLNTKFCIKCGNNLISQANPNVAETDIPSNLNINTSIPNVTNIGDEKMESVNMQSTQPVTQSVNNQFVQPDIAVPQNYVNTAAVQQSNSNHQNDDAKFDYVKYIIGSIIKPYEKFKSNEKELSNSKNVLTMSGILVLTLTILGLVNTMISEVRVKSFLSTKTEWVWENLKDIEYFKVIGQNLLIYAGILAAISGIYYIASLIIKRDTNFTKILAAVVTSLIPFAIASLVLSPILSMIYSILGIGITVAGLVFTLITYLELINEMVSIESENTKIYFNSICLFVVIAVGAFIAYKLVLGSLGSLISLF